ncbi:hypothetical protein HH303_07965 [Rhodospirillaceae bacterium KN72]|uniref:Tetratricopeptide repeat protein n=1 Tax=Pacificispira spongiicola TaxID=2729598 RepID=A0A7Y0DZG4_9PROT|nr:hypothetical protein [Pacificispira spongiicola]NMM44411.1 hypothetical protein [Pacificispira spongiicola]
MWTRSWTGFSRKTLNSLPKAGAVALALLAVPAWVTPVLAQEAEQDNAPNTGQDTGQEPGPASDISKPTFDPGDGFRSSAVDPVTLAVLSDALLRLQFLAVAALESDEDVGLAQSGVVRAYLARRQAIKAVENASRIADTIWRSRSFLWIADYVAAVEKDPAKARDWVLRAISEYQTLNAPRDDGETINMAALRLARFGFIEDAKVTAGSIPGLLARISALQQISTIALKGRPTQAEITEAIAVLAETFQQAKNLDFTDLTNIDLLIDIGVARRLAGDTPGAVETFAYARELILSSDADRRFDALIKLAAKMVETGDQRGGMAIVRLVPEGAHRARAIAAVSAALGERDLDAAVPLFRLSMEETDRIEDQQERFDALTYLVSRQAAVGRLADAFESAYKITEDIPRAEALLGMGRVLIDQGKLKEALVLKDYIPYVGMRAQVMAPAAEGRGIEGDPVGASALLSEALDPTGYPYQAAFVPTALDKVLSAQVRVGLESADQAIFGRARELAEIIPGDTAQVKALVQVAIAEARRGRIPDAQKTISNAYRTTFEHRGDPGFDEALMSISLAQLAAGDLLGAYDTAARIPEPPNTSNLKRTADGGYDVPRYQALIRVAAAAGRLGDPNFGQEVTDKIGLDPAKAIGLAAVAIAMSNRSSDLIDVINDIRDGVLLEPNFETLAPKQEEAEPEKVPDEMPKAVEELGDAPELTPLPPS